MAELEGKWTIKLWYWENMVCYGLNIYPNNKGNQSKLKAKKLYYFFNKYN